MANFRSQEKRASKAKRYADMTSELTMTILVADQSCSLLVQSTFFSSSTTSRQKFVNLCQAESLTSSFIFFAFIYSWWRGRRDSNSQPTVLETVTLTN